MTRLLRWWLAATAVALLGMAVWAFAPVLVFVAVLTLWLGGIAAGMIALAYQLRNRLERRRGSARHSKELPR